MEAATPLRQPHVRLLGDRLVVDGLVVEDECAVRLVHEREKAGEPAPKVVTDAIAIGARVLDREQAGANAEFFKAEMERATREAEGTLAAQTEVLTRAWGEQVESIFGPEGGQLTQVMERHFSDGSTEAVQNKIRAVMQEFAAKSREELLKQFTSGDAHNPLADFKNASLAAIHHASKRQDDALTKVGEELTGLKVQLQALRDEKEKQLELAAEADRGTAKGRTYEERVFEAIETIAHAQGDDAEPVGDVSGVAGKKGDVVVGVEGCRGPARARIVFEAKDRRLSRPEAFRELNAALEQRDADFAVLVVRSEDELPAKLLPLREYEGDKLLVTYDAEDHGDHALRLAYALARARVLMAAGGSDAIDSEVLRETIERAVAELRSTSTIKGHLKQASNNIANSRELLETMEARVKEHLQEIDDLLAAAQARDAE